MRRRGTRSKCRPNNEESELQLLAREKCLEELAMKIKEQRRFLAIERMHLEAAKLALETNDLPNLRWLIMMDDDEEPGNPTQPPAQLSEPGKPMPAEDAKAPKTSPQEPADMEVDVKSDKQVP